MWSDSIIAPIRFLANVQGLVRHHHERFDGAGYPDGLKRDQIPLGARIIAVADAFDAMTSRRPYRAALDLDTAVQEIRRGSGKQFDPSVVEAFLEVLARSGTGSEKDEDFANMFELPGGVIR
jgi:HD-GYP domain-containing protein (c-di-GMP phosphodiesterase class II)